MPALGEWIRYIETIVPQRRVAIQAGGYDGRYPIALCRHFDKVVSAEPNRQSYKLLEKAAVPVTNLQIMNVGFWSEARTANMAMKQHKANTSWLQFPGTAVDLVTVDSLGLEPDLIWFDIQGSEHQALRGAVKTLERCTAVIIEETPNKGLELKVGDKPNRARAYLLELGFKEGRHIQLDTMFYRPP